MARANLGDPDQGSQSKRLKFVEQQWARFCLLETEIEYELTHYDGGYCACTKNGSTPDPQGRCYWHERGDEPNPRYGVHVVQYRTLPDGNPAGSLEDPRFYSIKWWPFSKDKHEFLTNSYRLWGDLRKHDILFYCQVGQFQKGQAQLAPDAWWLSSETTKKIVADLFSKNRMNILEEMRTYVPYEQQQQYVMAKMQRQAQRSNRGQQFGGQFGGQPGGFGGQPGFGGQQGFGGSPGNQGGFGGMPNMPGAPGFGPPGGQFGGPPFGGGQPNQFGGPPFGNQQGGFPPPGGGFPGGQGGFPPMGGGFPPAGGGFPPTQGNPFPNIGQGNHVPSAPGASFDPFSGLNTNPPVNSPQPNPPMASQQTQNPVPLMQENQHAAFNQQAAPLATPSGQIPDLDDLVSSMAQANNKA